jgi:hypothetical protein
MNRRTNRIPAHIEELTRRMKAEMAFALPDAEIISEYRKLPTRVRNEASNLVMPCGYKAGKLLMPRAVNPKNLLLYSHRFNNAAWTPVNWILSPNTTANPLDGGLNATTLFETATTAQRYIQITAASRPTCYRGQTYTFSFYVKPIGRTQCLVAAQANAATVIDLTTNNTQTAAVGGANVMQTNTTFKVTLLADGWVRVEHTFTMLTNQLLYLYFYGFATTTSYAGDVTKGYILYGAQLERGSVATTYQANGGENLWTYSERLTTTASAWSGINLGITENYAANPLNGETTAERIGANSTISLHGIVKSITKAASAITYNLSIYAKAEGATSWIQLRMGNSGWAAYTGIYFNLADGTVGSTVTVGTAFTYVNNAITSLGNGWYRVSISVTSDATTTIFGGYYLATANGTDSFGGAGATLQHWFGAQLVQGSNVIPYFKTTYLSSEGRTLDYDWNYSRGGNATMEYKDGSVRFAPANLVLRSEEFENASWLKVNMGITANQILAPDGTLTADLITTTSTGVQHYIYQSVSKSGAPTTYTMSVYLKAGTATWAKVTVGANSLTAGWFVYANLSSGTLGSNGAIGTGFTYLGSTITALADGWYRVSLTVTTESTTSVFFVVYTATADGADFTAAGLTQYIWGGMLSLGIRVIDYIQTTSAALYTPRFEYRQGAYRGMLHEPAATNLLINSGNITVWSKSNLTTTPDATASPDETTTTASLLTNSANNAINYASQALSKAASATTYTLSVFVKAGTATWIRIGMFDGTLANGYQVYMNIATGAIGTGNAIGTGYSYISSDLVAYGNGWYRLSVTGTTDATTATYAIIGFAGGNNTPTGTTNGLTFSAWGAQLETNRHATSYIPTTTASATKAADVLSAVSQPEWYDEGTDGGSSYFHGIIYKPATSTLAYIITRTATTGRMLFDAGTVGFTDTNLLMHDGTNQTGNMATTGNQLLKVASGWSPGVMRLAANGNLSTQVTFTGIMPGTTIFIGGNGGVARFHFRCVAFFLRNLSDSEKQLITSSPEI